MRGDRPSHQRPDPASTAFTPHARGSTAVPCYYIARIRVYPACAGIDPGPSGVRSGTAGLPRMRGDRPSRSPWIRHSSWFTPHARGSTTIVMDVIILGLVYPACAGIDRCTARRMTPPTCLPRMRGDRPRPSPPVSVAARFTPHARGSTHGQRRL